MSRPSSSPTSLRSVTTSWQSVWRMSVASSAPRRVGLMPTIVAPHTAPAPSQKLSSGTFSSRKPMWNGPGRRSAARERGACRRRARVLVPRPALVLEQQRRCAGRRGGAGSSRRRSRRRASRPWPRGACAGCSVPGPNVAYTSIYFGRAAGHGPRGTRQGNRRGRWDLGHGARHRGGRSQPRARRSCWPGVIATAPRARRRASLPDGGGAAYAMTVDVRHEGAVDQLMQDAVARSAASTASR